jgi:hypothetical protein
MKIPVLTLLLAAALGCAAAPEPAPSGSDALWRQIQAELADDGCDNDGQCHSLGVGAKACGGPERYVAWSSRSQDGVRLRQLAERHAAARRAEDRRAGMMSTCSVTPDPGALCRAGHCVTGTPGPGGANAK